MTELNDTTKPHYVYAHLNGMEIFYIGKGVRNRAHTTSGRTVKWESYVQDIKNDYEVIIIKRFKTNDAALRFEKKLIQKHQPSCNYTHTKTPVSLKVNLGKVIAMAKSKNENITMTWHPEVEMWALYPRKGEGKRLWLSEATAKKIQNIELNLLTDEEICSNVDISRLASSFSHKGIAPKKMGMTRPKIC